MANVQHQFPFLSSTHTVTTEIYTLSLHDALPISEQALLGAVLSDPAGEGSAVDLVQSSTALPSPAGDRKSTRLNSSHTVISYAVFCLKKKNLLITNGQAGVPAELAAQRRETGITG